MALQSMMKLKPAPAKAPSDSSSPVASASAPVSAGGSTPSEPATISTSAPTTSVLDTTTSMDAVALALDAVAEANGAVAIKQEQNDSDEEEEQDEDEDVQDEEEQAATPPADTPAERIETDQSPSNDENQECMEEPDSTSKNGNASEGQENEMESDSSSGSTSAEGSEQPSEPAGQSSPRTSATNATADEEERSVAPAPKDPAPQQQPHVVRQSSPAPKEHSSPSAENRPTTVKDPTPEWSPNTKRAEWSRPHQQPEAPRRGQFHNKGYTHDMDEPPPEDDFALLLRRHKESRDEQRRERERREREREREKREAERREIERRERERERREVEMERERERERWELERREKRERKRAAKAAAKAEQQKQQQPPPPSAYTTFAGSRGRVGGYGSPPGYPAADALASQQPHTTSLPSGWPPGYQPAGPAYRGTQRPAEHLPTYGAAYGPPPPYGAPPYYPAPGAMDAGMHAQWPATRPPFAVGGEEEMDLDSEMEDMQQQRNFSSMSSSLDSILAQAKETVARREGNTNQQHHDLLRQKDEELARLRSLLAERDRTSASASAAVVAAAGTGSKHSQFLPSDLEGIDDAFVTALRRKVKEKEDALKARQEAALNGEHSLVESQQKLADTEGRRAYLDKRAHVLREQLRVIEEMRSTCVEEEGEIRARVAAQKSDLATKRAQIQQLKLSLESARVRLAEAYVEWKISNEMATSPDSPAAASFMPSPTAVDAAEDTQQAATTSSTIDELAALRAAVLRSAKEQQEKAARERQRKEEEERERERAHAKRREEEEEKAEEKEQEQEQAELVKVKQEEYEELVRLRRELERERKRVEREKAQQARALEQERQRKEKREKEKEHAELLRQFNEEKERLLRLRRENQEREQQLQARRLAEEEALKKQQLEKEEEEKSMKKKRKKMEEKQQEEEERRRRKAREEEEEREKEKESEAEDEDEDESEANEEEQEERSDQGEEEAEATANGVHGHAAEATAGAMNVDLEVESAEEHLFPVSLQSRCVLPLHLVPSLIPSAVYSRLPSLLWPKDHSTTSKAAGFELDMEGLEFTAPTNARRPKTKASRPSRQVSPIPGYRSPLKCLRSWRLSPQYDLRLDSLTYSHKINPWIHLCAFELHGTCNDDECPFQHLRDATPTKAEVLEDLASYAEEVGAGSKEDLLREVQETHGVDPLSCLVDLINERRSDASYPHSAVLSARASHANPFEGRQRTNRRGRQSRPARPMRGPSSRDASAPPNKKQRVSPARERAAAAGEALDLSTIGRDFVPVLEDNSDDETGGSGCDDANVSRQPGPGGGISAAMSATGDAAGEDSSSRYYGERSLESLEQAIRANKHNVAGWLNYAFVQHAKGRDAATEEERRAAKERPLVVLARALEANATSEELWKAYLHFYLHQERTPSATEIRDLFESAVNFLPRSYFMWRIYVAHIDDVRGRALMCERALGRLAELDLTSGNAEQQQQYESQSRDVLDMILLLAHTYTQAGRPAAALARLHHLLFQTADPHAASEGPDAEVYQPPASPAANAGAVMAALTVEHRCAIALAYVYLLAHRRLPSAPDRAMRFPHQVFLIDWRPLARDVLAHPAAASSSGPAPSSPAPSRLERLADALRRVVDLFPAVAATSATPGGALAAKARMVAQLNFLLLKLNTGEVDACRLMCQQYLRSTPTMAELWIVYAWIEEVAGNHSDAELILNKFVLRYSDQFAGWHAYALFALVRKSPAAALDVLARSVGQFLTPGPEGAKELALPLATVRSVFHALLHLPAPEGQAPLRLAATSAVKDPERNVHLWQNFCLFESLYGASTARSAFEAALSALPTASDRLPIWHQYVALRQGIEGAAGVQKVVDLLSRCFSDVATPAAAPLPQQLQSLHPYARKVIRDTAPMSYAWHGLLLESALAGLHPTQRGPVQRAVLQIIPAYTLLSFSVARFELGRSNIPAARSLLDAALRLNPAFDVVWLNAARVRMREGDEAGARQLLQKAVQTHPTSALLWLNWIALARGGDEQAKETEAERRSQAERRGVVLPPASVIVA